MPTPTVSPSLPAMSNVNVPLKGAVQRYQTSPLHEKLIHVGSSCSHVEPSQFAVRLPVCPVTVCAALKLSFTGTEERSAVRMKRPVAPFLPSTATQYVAVLDGVNVSL